MRRRDLNKILMTEYFIETYLNKRFSVKYFTERNLNIISFLIDTHHGIDGENKPKKKK
jgi:hypothetical protein